MQKNLNQLCMHVCLSEGCWDKGCQTTKWEHERPCRDIMGYNCIQSCISRQDAISIDFFLKAMEEIALNLESTQFFLQKMKVVTLFKEHIIFQIQSVVDLNQKFDPREYSRFWEIRLQIWLGKTSWRRLERQFHKFCLIIIKYRDHATFSDIN